MPATKTSRIWSIAVGLIGLSLCVFALAQVYSYFKTGSEAVNKYDIGMRQLSEHNPDIKWLKDDTNIKGEINPFIRNEIKRSYSDAWGILNLSLLHQEDLGLSENFTKSKVKQIIETLHPGQKINRTDLNHNLQLHFISYDKQIVSFTDHNVVTENLIKSEGYNYTIKDTCSYQIVMTLQDGKWKVNKYYRKINGE